MNKNKHEENGKRVKPKRANGMGCLFRRGNMWWGKFMRKGIMTVRSLGIHVHEEGKSDKQQREAAEEKLFAETAPVRLGSDIDALLYLKAKIEHMNSVRRSALAASRDIRLKDAPALFLKERKRIGKDGETTKAFAADLAEFIEWKGGESFITSVTQEIADMYVSVLEKNQLANSTFNRKINALRIAWEILKVSEITCAGNPWKDIAPKKIDSVARDTLTDDEIERIKAAAGDRYGGDLRMLFVIGEYTGLRLSDAATLRWSEVFLDRKAIVKETGKTGAVVHLPILPKFEEEILAQKKRLASWNEEEYRAKGKRQSKTAKIPKGYEDYVVPRMAVVYMRSKNCSTLTCASRKAFIKAGVKLNMKVEGCKQKRPLKGFHSLRATWVTRCQAAGIPVSIIMQTVGHATANMTQHYTHIKEQEVLAAFEKAGVMGGGGGDGENKSKTLKTAD